MGVIKTTLNNGLRVLVEPVSHVGSASIGLWCRTGSVNERPQEGGITHFIEHMLFKGTKSRSAKQIAEAIEGRGGMLNAFTDKEQTCYYCRVLATDWQVAIDVLCDMVLNSLIDPEELEREKGVIVEEIKRGEDEPGDHVHDLHLESLWSGHELGKPIIGTRESVVSFQPSDLKDYIGRQYRGTNLLLSVAGNVDPSEVAKALDERLAGIESEASRPELARPVPVPGVLDVKKDIEQVHFCIGTEGVSSYDEDLYAHAVMDGVLGSGMSSRLFQEVRERRGLAYAIGSYSLTYTVGGAFTVYGGTGAQTWPQVQEVVRAEFDKLMVDYVSDEELNKVKQCLSGNLALSLEGMNARMIRMAKNEFVYGRDIPLEETITKIQAVKPGDIVEIARERLSEDKIRTTSIGPA